MIHRYRSNGYNIVMDVNSGSVHVVDDIVYEVIPLSEQLVSAGIRDVDTVTIAVETLQELQFSHYEVEEAVGEVISLAEKGILFAEDSHIHPSGEHHFFCQHPDMAFADNIMVLAEQIRGSVCEKEDSHRGETVFLMHECEKTALEMINEDAYRLTEKYPEYQAAGDFDRGLQKVMPEKCRKCFAKYYCSAEWITDSAEHHDFHNISEPACELQRKCVECAIMIKAALADKDK